MAEQLSRPLTDAGVAVINVGGVAFGPFVKLFGPDRLPFRCAVISDGDPPRTEEDEAGRSEEDPALSATAQQLRDQENENVRVFLSAKTLEWDIVAASNWDLALAALGRIRPRVARRLAEEHGQSTEEERADALLAAVERHKGRFAQALLAEIRAGQALRVPQYLQEAIEWLTEPVPDGGTGGSAEGPEAGGEAAPEAADGRAPIDETQSPPDE